MLSLWGGWGRARAGRWLSPAGGRRPVLPPSPATATTPPSHKPHPTAPTAPQPRQCRSAPPRCLDGGNVDFLHRHHRFEGTLCLIASSRERVRQHARGDLPGEAPAVLAPTTLAFLPPIVDDRIPVTVRLFLIVRRDLERKGLAVLERRAAVETETGNAHHGELHCQYIALLAVRVVAG